MSFPLEIWVQILNFTSDNVSYLSLLCSVPGLSEIANSSTIVDQAKDRFVRFQSYERRFGWVLKYVLPNGKKHGEYKIFDNYKIREERIYVNGKKEGSTGHYYPDGKIEVRGCYQKNKKVGVWKYYLGNGKLDC